MVIKNSLGNTCWNFLDKSIVLFTLGKVVLIRMLKDNFESKCRLKMFENWLKWSELTEVLSKNILRLIFLVVFLLKMTS